MRHPLLSLATALVALGMLAAAAVRWFGWRDRPLVLRRRPAVSHRRDAD